MTKKVRLWKLGNSEHSILPTPRAIEALKNILEEAKEGGFKEGKLTGLLCDCHIYNDHLEQVKEQLSRTPRQLPQVELTHSGSIFDWTHKDVKLTGYDPHPAIKAKVTV